MVSRLYASHVPLDPLSRATLTLATSLGALLYPQRADLVAAVGELTGTNALKGIRERLSGSPTGQLILRDKPIITNDFLRRCKDAPEGSFGRSYHAFMQHRRFDADSRPPVRFVDDPDLAYVATRYRQVHDLWHVLFNCRTSLLGETTLKAVEFVQTGLPMTAAAVLAGQAKLKANDRLLLNTQLLPWAARAGAQCTDLMVLYYEHHVDDGLEDLRRQWRIIPAPSFIEASAASSAVT